VVGFRPCIYVLGIVGMDIRFYSASKYFLEFRTEEKMCVELSHVDVTLMSARGTCSLLSNSILLRALVEYSPRRGTPDH
jgi:hypothetical protein